MTIPEERTRSLRFAHQTMREIVDDEQAPQEWRDKVAALLARYPSPQEVLELIQAEDPSWPPAVVEAISDAADLLDRIHRRGVGSPETRYALLVTLRHHPTRHEMTYFVTCPVQEWLAPEEARLE